MECSIVACSYTLLLYCRKHQNFIDIDAIDVIGKGYEPWLSKINELFKTDKDISEFYQLNAKTDRALLFSLEGVEVELLVSPIWSRPGELYSFIETVRPEHRDK